MAIRMEELKQSRGLSVDQTNREITYQYWVLDATGETDYAQAYTYVRLNTPIRRDGLGRKSIKGTPVGGTVWAFDVAYDSSVYSEAGLGEAGDGTTDPTGGVADPQSSAGPLGPSFSFSTGGGTTHITQSIETITSVDIIGGAAPDIGKAIGWTKEGIQGTDIITPNPEFTRKIKGQPLTFAYYYALCEGTGCKNIATAFGVFKPGELLYLGCDGQCGPDQIWELSHKFAYSRNRVNLVVAPGLTVSAKKGWDYLWVAYHDEKIGGMRRSKPIQAYVEQVYDSYDFTLLKCGA